MKIKSNIILIIIFLIVLILIGILYISTTKIEVAKVTVEITKEKPYNTNNLNGSYLDNLIGNISIRKEYINVFQAKESTDMFKPGINIGLFQNKRIISGWVSIPLEDRGIYDIYLKLNQPVEKGETIRIAVYVNDEKGNSIIGKRQDIIWD